MVIPSGPNKTCQVVEQSIKPLNLYERVDSVPESVPLSSLKMSGRFTLTDAFVWANAIFPDVPQLGEEDDQEHVLDFKSAFLGTYIRMKLNEGSITILSNNLTSMTIAKDTITAEAQIRKINMDIQSEISNDSIYHMLEQLNPQMEYLFNLAKQEQLIDGLKELENESANEEGGISYLSDEFK